jgi:hypothetical protein
MWMTGVLGDFASLSEVLPVRLTDQYRYATAITYTAGVPDPILSRGLTSSFTFLADDFDGAETLFSAKPGASAYYASNCGLGGQGLIGWD